MGKTENGATLDDAPTESLLNNALRRFESSIENHESVSHEKYVCGEIRGMQSNSPLVRTAFASCQASFNDFENKKKQRQKTGNGHVSANKGADQSNGTDSPGNEFQ
ncbi:MAG: hypothetical protein WA194_08210 [Patescibacteria group bacterium]